MPPGIRGGSVRVAPITKGRFQGSHFTCVPVASGGSARGFEIASFSTVDTFGSQVNLLPN